MPAPAPAYYSFGEKAKALIALKLTSAGQISVYSYVRPPGATAMVARFSTNVIQVPNPAGLTFTFSVNTKNEGLFTVEPDGWPVPYESNIIHFLGQFNPFGVDDIPYQGIRPQSDPANRIMNCTFLPNGDLVVADGVGGSSDTIHTAKLDGAVPGSGCIWAAVRVTEANFVPNCATLTFPAAVVFSSLAGSPQQFMNQSAFVLRP